MESLVLFFCFLLVEVCISHTECFEGHYGGGPRWNPWCCSFAFCSSKSASQTRSVLRATPYPPSTPPKLYLLGRKDSFAFCSSKSASQHHRSVLRATPCPPQHPQNCICLLGRLSLINLTRCNMAQCLVWRVWGPFPPAAAMVVAVVVCVF